MNANLTSVVSPAIIITVYSPYIFRYPQIVYLVKKRGGWLIITSEANLDETLIIRNRIRGVCGKK